MAVESGKFAGGIVAPVAKGRSSRIPKAETRKKVEGRNPNKIRKALVFRWSAGFMDSRMETAASDGA